jgi:hypothetical protein
MRTSIYFRYCISTGLGNVVVVKARLRALRMYWESGGDHTQRPSCGSEPAQAMRKEVFRYIPQGETLELHSQCPVDRSVAILGGTLHGNARGT